MDDPGAVSEYDALPLRLRRLAFFFSDGMGAAEDEDEDDAGASICSLLIVYQLNLKRQDQSWWSPTKVVLISFWFAFAETNFGIIYFLFFYLFFVLLFIFKRNGGIKESAAKVQGSWMNREFIVMKVVQRRTAVHERGGRAQR
jgi:hypothetical protein